MKSFLFFEWCVIPGCIVSIILAVSFDLQVVEFTVEYLAICFNFVTYSLIDPILFLESIPTCSISVWPCGLTKISPYSVCCRSQLVMSKNTFFGLEIVSSPLSG